MDRNALSSVTRVVLLLPKILEGVGKPVTLAVVMIIWLVIASLKFVSDCHRIFSNWLLGNYSKAIFKARRNFENRWARFSIGLAIVPLAVTTSFAYPRIAQGQEIVVDPNSLILSENATAALKTMKAIRAPLSYTILNQGYLPGHPGLDLKGPINEPIYPIMAGNVIEATRSYTGYGNYVVIEHAQGLQSLYAHLNWIGVHKGDQVNTDSILGGLGTTGRSTGPHLHLEVIDNGKKVNPLTVIGGR